MRHAAPVRISATAIFRTGVSQEDAAAPFETLEETNGAEIIAAASPLEGTNAAVRPPLIAVGKDGEREFGNEKNAAPLASQACVLGDGTVSVMLHPCRLESQRRSGGDHYRDQFGSV